MSEIEMIEPSDVGTLDSLSSAPAEPVRPETATEHVARLQATVENIIAWAAAKADAVEKRILDVGGEVPADLKASLANLRKTLGAAPAA